jgi:hypothetical protein
VAVDPDGRSATLVFAGFHTANASNDLADYRQIGRVDLELDGYDRDADDEDDGDDENDRDN